MTYVTLKKSVDYMKAKALLEGAIQLCGRHEISKKNSAEYYKLYYYIQKVPSMVTKKSFHHSL